MTIFDAFRRVMKGLLLVSLVGLLAVALFIGYCAYTLPLSHPPASWFDSMPSSSDGIAVSCPIFFAANWSTVMPRYACTPILA